MNYNRAKPVAVTGIKPTGQVHVGNYIGSIRPALDLVPAHRTYYFIADYHALTTVHDPEQLRRHVLDVAATWLALGLDPDETVFFRQSAIPDILELMWTLACVCPKGLLNRAHAYKAALAANIDAGRRADENIYAGLFNYPLLMAADMLCFQADRVPVGRDQRQHVEIARDVAAAFNRAFTPIFNMPQASVQAGAATMLGLDGRKMSSAYGNEIPVLADPDTIRRRVMRIVTDSRPPAAPKDPDRCSVFAIYRHFGSDSAISRLRSQYLEGGVAYQNVKEALADTLIDRFASSRRQYQKLMADPGQIASILDRGARQARQTSRETLKRVRQATGMV
jgi:tryptophanyl-tRNA synthetase